MRFLSVFLASLLLLTIIGCDKGRKGLNNIMESYGDILEKDYLEISDLEKTSKLSAGLSIIAKANPGKDSAEEAKKNIEILEQKMVPLRAKIEHKYSLVKDKTLKVMTLVEQKAIDLAQHHKKMEKRSEGKLGLDNPNRKMSENDCRVHDHNREFEKGPKMFGVSVTQIKKIGDKEVLVTVLANPSDRDLTSPEAAQKKMGKEKSENKYMYSISSIKIDCKKADAYAKAYSDYLNVAKELKAAGKLVQSAASTHVIRDMLDE